ncbi:DNA topoisomerase 1 [Hypericibacter adhaerens]|uniref:DNA topoisomerase 1 n=2 Tax=Hypericibacter adhaerens TaxID=2602016 RepID=A0A5J6N7L6_9PROT|nr:DNA topoisomerase 1 [Hypericibacter adhaerens]
MTGFAGGIYGAGAELTEPMNSIVVVESPAKAKTINKYLGKGYHVLASFGHVRDLPPKDGSVRPDEDFAMSWQVEGRGEQRLKEIASAVKGADRLILATDPDREGEAISWHLTEELKRRKALEGVEVERVVFNEVTKAAVLDAMRHPRKLDKELVEAYLARRALDYLVGFTLSPVLWRKLPGSRSAGRVQSVALRLICEREAEIEAFKPQEYWTVEGRFRTEAGQVFPARLIELDGKKLEKFDLPNEAAAQRAVAIVKGGEPFAVRSVERKTVRRNPFPPFTTSTLQQEASRKLGLGASRTMRIAQRLYEGVDLGGETVGLITYMRTDGVQLSQEAIAAARKLVQAEHGKEYVPDEPRQYKSTAKNAQEAHEAIRPSDISRKPGDVARYLEADEAKLYELIWKRTVASQMASAILDQVSVDIASKDGKAVLRATGSVVTFDGFLALYQEDRDDPADDDENGGRLPALKEREGVALNEVTPEQHFTQPPPRYSEASLVKRLEELGIGRPSTYASIIQVLQDRNYVKLEKKRFIPEDRGRVVTAFLENFFDRYVEYNFTADLENQLDDISGGRIDWKTVLRDFWRDFSAAVAGTKDLSISQVIDELDQELGPHFFPERADGSDPRLCPGCQSGRLSLKLGKFGAFIGCSNYPDCRYTRRLGVSNGEGDGSDVDMGPKLLGEDPATKLPVSLRKGPYGTYIQLGEAVPAAPKPKKKKKKAKGEKDETKPNGAAEAQAAPAAPEPPKPKRVSLPRGVAPNDVTLDQALALLSLPRLLGNHPEDQLPVVAGIGRFGPYIKHGDRFKSLGKDDDVLTIGMNRAVALLAEPSTGRGGRGGPPGKKLGEHPADSQPVTLHAGRYGHYVKHGKINATLPKGVEPESFTLEQAIPLLEARAQAKGVKRGGKAPKKKASAKPAPANDDAPEGEPKPAKVKAAASAKAKPPAKVKAKTKAKSKAKAKGKTESAAPETDGE